jgi:hypothetical protein
MIHACGGEGAGAYKNVRQALRWELRASGASGQSLDF